MTGAVDPAVLSGLALYRGLSPEQLEKLAPLLHQRTLPAGANVITAEEPGGGAYVILSGSAKVYVAHTDGSEVILTVLGPGEVVGEMSVADSLGRSASVLTLGDSTLPVDGPPHLPLEHGGDAAGSSQPGGHPLPALRLADTHTRSLAALDVHGRVAAQLLAFAREYGEPRPDGGVLIPLRLTQSDLADLVGASRVRVNQALGYFR